MRISTTLHFHAASVPTAPAASSTPLAARAGLLPDEAPAGAMPTQGARLVTADPSARALRFVESALKPPPPGHTLAAALGDLFAD